MFKETFVQGTIIEGVFFVKGEHLSKETLTKEAFQHDKLAKFLQRPYDSTVAVNMSKCMLYVVCCMVCEI